ncbi:hypothetical protein CB1_000435021 [Camelus ferus]|nr:hypothetical protein CB1_000435021 [Camelus ferus]
MFPEGAKPQFQSPARQAEGPSLMALLSLPNPRRLDFVLECVEYALHLKCWAKAALPPPSVGASALRELSVEEAQDPFLEAIDKVLAWIHPDLRLFRVSERRAPRRRRKAPKAAQPALAVVLFLQEEYGEEQILQLHRTLQRPPWRHHHTERVPSRFLPYLPCSQDFFTLAPGTPLWAIRPVHYGREIVRFTIYCRHDNYADILKFYELILRRSPSQRKTDFCIFPVFSNLDVDIQFSLKRLPRDQAPVPTDSSVLEFRVKDIGELVPLLPNPCSPISEGRWQTEDHDGNKILLQFSRMDTREEKVDSKLGDNVLKGTDCIYLNHSECVFPALMTVLGAEVESSHEGEDQWSGSNVTMAKSTGFKDVP